MEQSKNPGQAQKELFHNEALQALDTVVAACVEEAALNDPPAAPIIGACYIVGGAPTGEWVGHANAIASFSNSGWRFMAAVEGMSVYARSTGIDARFRAGAWEYGNVRASALIIGDQQVVGSRAAAIAGPSGGTVIDSAARTTIGQILAALRQHGLIET